MSRTEQRERDRRLGKERDRASRILPRLHQLTRQQAVGKRPIPEWLWWPWTKCPACGGQVEQVGGFCQDSACGWPGVGVMARLDRMLHQQEQKPPVAKRPEVRKAARKRQRTARKKGRR